ncbi:hypothetical protein ABZ891_26515 [Streptomyces sp. NPDC047023]|uniref:MmyB family transcriptional regulator n=1 Tax=Streptomyces sp. NPDC047023 TaxID=3155139 RepID=UPI0033C50E0B
MIETWMPFPAHVMDAYWNIVMYNDAASLVLGLSTDGPQNCLLSFFTDPRYRGPAGNWETVAPKVVAQYRAAWSERPEDEGFQAVVAEAKSASEEFARLWEQHDVLPGGRDSKVVEHPLVGTLHLETTQLRLPARPDLAILLYTPLPVAETAAKVERLASPEGQRESAYPVAG